MQVFFYVFVLHTVYSVMLHCVLRCCTLYCVVCTMCIALLHYVYCVVCTLYCVCVVLHTVLCCVYCVLRFALCCVHCVLRCVASLPLFANLII